MNRFIINIFILGFIFCNFFLSSVSANVQVFNRSAGTQSEIKNLIGKSKLYISTKDLARSLSSRLYENKDRKKLVLYIKNKRIGLDLKIHSNLF